MLIYTLTCTLNSQSHFKAHMVNCTMKCKKPAAKTNICADYTWAICMHELTVFEQNRPFSCAVPAANGPVSNTLSGQSLEPTLLVEARELLRHFIHRRRASDK